MPIALLTTSSPHRFGEYAGSILNPNCTQYRALFPLLQPGQHRIMATPEASPVERKFPDNFMWGTATASYQIEGAANVDREPSIWDRFSKTPGKTANRDTGDVACDHYHRYKEDVQLMKSLGTKYYRFSIAWPRILPKGGVDPSLANKPGITFYNNLIDELLANGIEPVATLYHWDLPVAVEDRCGGWAGDGGTVTEEFEVYARVCFQSFGDRVKWWITLNEPWCSSFMSYTVGEHAPGKRNTPEVDVYVAGHNLLLAHAKAVQVYRHEFQEKQQGQIGIALNTNWAEPEDVNKEECLVAAQRDMDFELGWFADPIYKGDYPASMKLTVGDRLPEFSAEEKAMLLGSSDFFGLNHYSTHYSARLMDAEDKKGVEHGYVMDKGTVSNQDPSWQRTDMGWAIVPWGLQKLCEYIDASYKPVGGIIITENGLATDEKNLSEMQADTLRVQFYSEYIGAMHAAIVGEKSADVRGYFAWSLLDNFEWAYGYDKRFGLIHVDYETQVRTPKPVASWYAKVIAHNAL